MNWLRLHRSRTLLLFEGLLQKVSHDKGISYNTKQREQLLYLLEHNPSQWIIDLNQDWQIVRVYDQLKVTAVKKALTSKRR